MKLSSRLDRKQTGEAGVPVYRSRVPLTLVPLNYCYKSRRRFCPFFPSSSILSTPIVFDVSAVSNYFLSLTKQKRKNKNKTNDQLLDGIHHYRRTKSFLCLLRQESRLAIESERLCKVSLCKELKKKKKKEKVTFFKIYVRSIEIYFFMYSNKIHYFF